ncbi:cyclohexanecarboxylate-CoA ligase [Paractinoplanes deccanensis]|uniref:Cyclohexanecarboxylate-CoA ligase n=1 Tax=Paractinoplanes deccanensis TaxID=113561 RepID=A0ABQ3YBZ3_9ACTN|nr:AMP-binding protein [Actinoplanes deccanensis]GID77503.1 cyclohexanecarboxylate-CoA ligase [Actinoplanes deccanensis]
MTDVLRDFRAPADLARRYRAAGVWRDTGPIADLDRWRREQPGATAIVQYRDGAAGETLTYADYALRVERFAAARHSLGVRAGDVVAVWLPNVWQVSALLLACARLGAVTAPILPTIGPRELSKMLARTGATVCVTVGANAGVLAAAAPGVRHRVLLGGAAGGDISFEEYFERTAWERRHPMGLGAADEDPDRAAIVLFTSGTSGEPKGVVHSFNTIYAGISAIAAAERVGPGDTMFIPHALTFIGGILYGITMPLLAGAASVVLDRWDGETGLRLLRESHVTVMFAAPVFFQDLLRAVRRDPAPLPPLRLAVTGATTVPPRLVREVPEVLGVALRTLWGMTEVAAQTWTRATDPADRGTASDGSPGPGLEVGLRTLDGEGAARLFVRGAGVALATLGRDGGRLRVLAEHDDGWYDTGDLARPDGHGGIRILGRVADRIGGSLLIPVNDVESELLEHPSIDDVAVVGYLDETGYERPCAVVVAHEPVPSLAGLREFLTGRGMTEWYQPDRLEVRDRLPRNSAGKVLKAQLRESLR